MVGFHLLNPASLSALEKEKEKKKSTPEPKQEGQVGWDPWLYDFITPTNYSKMCIYEKIYDTSIL